MRRVSADYPNHLSDVPCPLPRRIERVRVSIASPLIQPSPFDRRVGIRIVTFEACSGFTHVTARPIAQPPKAAFVTRLQPCRLPGRTARQLPDQSTTLWVRSSLTDGSRPRGARSNPDVAVFLDEVGFTPMTGHQGARAPYPKTAKRRHAIVQD